MKKLLAMPLFLAALWAAPASAHELVKYTIHNNTTVQLGLPVLVVDGLEFTNPDGVKVKCPTPFDINPGATGTCRGPQDIPNERMLTVDGRYWGAHTASNHIHVFTQHTIWINGSLWSGLVFTYGP